MVRDNLRYIFSFSQFMFWPISEIFSSFALSREIISTRSSLICRGWLVAAVKLGASLTGEALKAGVVNWPAISIGEGRHMNGWSGFFSWDSIRPQIVSEFLEDEPFGDRFSSGSSF